MYSGASDRYENMTYDRVGNSGLKLSVLGLGFWHNFGSIDPFEKQKEIVEEDIEQIIGGNYISKIDKYFDCFYTHASTLLDYLSDKYIIALDEERKIEQRTENIKQDRKNLISALVEKEKMIPQALEDTIE